MTHLSIFEQKKLQNRISHFLTQPETPRHLNVLREDMATQYPGFNLHNEEVFQRIVISHIVINYKPGTKIEVSCLEGFHETLRQYLRTQRRRNKIDVNKETERQYRPTPPWEVIKKYTMKKKRNRHSHAYNAN